MADDATAYPGRLVVEGAVVATARIRFFVPGIVQPRVTGRLATAHQRALDEWRAGWTRAVYVAWLSDGRPTWFGPASIVLTAHLTRSFGDGLLAALEPVRDEVLRLIVDHHLRHSVSVAEDIRPRNRGVGVVVQRP